MLPEIEKLYNSSVVHAEDSDGNFVPAKQQNKGENDVSLLYESAEEYLQDALYGYENTKARDEAVQEAIQNTEDSTLSNIPVRAGGSLYPKIKLRTILEGFKESGSHPDF